MKAAKGAALEVLTAAATSKDTKQSLTLREVRLLYIGVPITIIFWYARLCLYFCEADGSKRDLGGWLALLPTR